MPRLCFDAGVFRLCTTLGKAILFAVSKNCRSNAVWWPDSFLVGIHYYIPAFSAYPEFIMRSTPAVCFRCSVFTQYWATCIILRM
jgi:hypothetical protein